MSASYYNLPCMLFNHVLICLQPHCYVYQDLQCNYQSIGHFIVCTCIKEFHWSTAKQFVINLHRWYIALPSPLYQDKNVTKIKVNNNNLLVFSTFYSHIHIYPISPSRAMRCSRMSITIKVPVHPILSELCTTIAASITNVFCRRDTSCTNFTTSPGLRGTPRCGQALKWYW